MRGFQKTQNNNKNTRATSDVTKTLLPTRNRLLVQDILGENISVAVDQRKETHRRHYDTHSTPLKELSVGQAVRMKLPRGKTCFGVCRSSLGQRSYNVEVAGQTYRRNRRQFRATSQIEPLGTLDDLTPDEGEPEPTGQRQTSVVDVPLPPCPSPNSPRGTPSDTSIRDELYEPRPMTLRNGGNINPPQGLIEQ